jgi:hypothetical protein
MCCEGHEMKISKSLIFAFLLGMTLTSIKCKDEATKPPEEPVKGPRTYNWTIDTLSYPGSIQTVMSDIWASSPSDVYVVGHNDQPGPGTMFHYDGKKWSTTHFHAAEGGAIDGAVDLSAIYGFSSNDIYAVGSRLYTNNTTIRNSSLIIHFDGIKWTEISIAHQEKLVSIFGASSSDIWAGGRQGTLYHYLNGVWSNIPFDSTVGFAQFVGVSRTEIYARCTREIDKVQPLDSTQYLIYKFNGFNWSVIDSFYQVPPTYLEKFGLKLWITSDDQLYSAGQKIYKWIGVNWTQMFNSGHTFYTLYGTSENNIFAVGYGNQCYHYNGNDWFSFERFKDSNKYGISIWCNKEEAFLLSSDGSKSYIYHGK